MKFVGKYLLNILLALDRLGNAFALGDPGETISSHLGRLAAKNGGKIPDNRPFAKILAAGLNAIEKDHIQKAIELDEGKEGLIDNFTIEEIGGKYHGE